MKFTIERDALLRALMFVGGAVQRKGTIPILATVRIEARGDGVDFAGTDLDMRAESRAPAEVAKPGAVAVCAETLAGFAKKLSKSALVAVELEDRKKEGVALVVKSGRARLNAPVLAVDDFPDMKPMEARACTFTLPAANLLRLIDKTRAAISTEETRYYLNGLFLTFADDADGAPVLRAVATDGHVLAMADVDRPEVDHGATLAAIVPRLALAEIKKQVADHDGDVEVTVSESLIRVRAGEAALTSKLVDGSFPEYARVIPKGNNIAVTAARAPLAAALERAMIVVSERTSGITMTAHGDAMSVRSRSQDYGEVLDEIDCEGPAAPFEIGFNGRLALQALAQGASEDVVMQFSDPAAPSLWRDPEDARALYVVMPLRTSA